ncbi:MAG: hypothetical protein OEV91_03050 [Desulfobulbaceae bacterium]|nr:hypothetical protein [Desulfobulbaceae bacterium]
MGKISRLRLFAGHPPLPMSDDQGVTVEELAFLTKAGPPCRTRGKKRNSPPRSLAPPADAGTKSRAVKD